VVLGGKNQEIKENFSAAVRKKVQGSRDVQISADEIRGPK